MNFSDWLRGFTYSPFFIDLARFLHIRSLMGRMYYLFSLPSDKIKKISFEGIEAQFHINNYAELRCVEGTLAKGEHGEGLVLRRLIHTVQPGDVVYDIGSYIGVHAIFMAMKTGKKGHVISFEPEADNYKNFERNVNINKLNHIILLRCALGDSFGEGILYNVGTMATLISHSSSSASFQKVKIVRGDDIVRNKNLPLPRIVKIDVEGYEYNVIRGLQTTLSNKTCQTVCCEVHPTMLPSDIKPQMVIELLKSIGFSQIEIYPHRYTWHTFCSKL